MKFLIAGAGIGGLTAALCLSRSGHEVAVFDQASQFGEVGAGLQCGANAMRVFNYLGLSKELEAVAVDPQRIEFCDGISGNVLYQIALGDSYQKKYGAPYLHIHRAHLHAALVSALEQCTGVSIELNAGVKSYQENADDVQLHLGCGRAVMGDCLIGADGVKSVVRDQLLGPRDADFTGHVAWRGVLPAERLPEKFMDKVTSNFMGKGKHMVIYYLKNQQLVNFVGVVENSQWHDDSWVSAAPWDELKTDFKGWHPTVQSVIDAVDKDKCFRWALYANKPLQNWSSNRVTLLGDAAHATLPFMASGAAMAIEDARILQRSVDQAAELEGPGVARALQLYQRNRITRTAKIQADSARFGKLYHVPSGWPLKLAFKALHVVGKRKERFLPEYDANTVELI